MATVEEEIMQRLERLTPAQKGSLLNSVLAMTGEPARGVSGREFVRTLPRISPEFARDLRMSLAESRRIPGQEDTLLKWALGEDAEATPAEPCERADPDGR